MAGVVSETEKAGQTRQVSAGKTNASEPLMKCRKGIDVIETRPKWLAWDAARGELVYGSSGDRHEGGVSPAQALVELPCSGQTARWRSGRRARRKVES
jgi:hypothetical protein